MFKLLPLLLISLSSCASNNLPSAKVQSDIVKAFSKEIIRLDGEGLIVRKNRSETFVSTANKIARDALSNNTTNDFLATFQKLDGTYTNLHSRAMFPNGLEFNELPFYKRQAIWLFAEVSKKESKYYIENIAVDKLKSKVSIGDQLIKINGIEVKDWLSENFLFCKYPMRIQCDRNFEWNLLSYRLSWRGEKDLVYTFNHKGDEVDVKMSFFNSSKPKDPLRKRCDYKWKEKYPNFKLKYMGFFTCLFEREDDKSVGLIRINSFQYNRNKASANPYGHIKEEVAAFSKFWIPRSGQYKDLIFDVIKNRGGNLPISYYELFLHGKFQEQYVRFKKTPEIENTKLRKAMFWETEAQELNFQKFIKSGVWEELSYGEFAPPMPMFCADNLKPCDESKFEAKKHSFNGKVHVMLNEECVSTCDAFVGTLKTKLKAKLYGFYQAADTAYSRLRLDAVKAPNELEEFKVQINGQSSKLPKGTIVSQVVAVSLATDEKGEIFNGNPLELNEFVPYVFGQNYTKLVLSKILNNL